MPKRHLTIQNKGNEHEQQSSSILTRLSSKRANTNESITNKKPKIEEKHIDKENIPKRQTRQSTKSKEREPSPLPSPPSSSAPPIEIIEPTPDKPVNPPPPEDTDDEFDNDEDEHLTLPIDDNDKGKDYPTNKEYLIYENARPNKQPLIISKTARYWANKYRKVLRHVNPDAYGMYIHADFSCYGELEVIENCLLDLTKTIFIVQQGIFNYQRKPIDKVNYILGFRRLETLTILLDYTDGISGIDDGDRFYAIMRVIGSCYVTILRGLLPDIMFKKIETIDENLIKKLNKISKQIPNFKYVLEQALIIGHMFLTIADVCSAYTNILQIVYCNWVLIMDKISIDLNQKSNDKLMKALKHASEIDRNNLEYGDKESFDFLKELRSYKENYGLGGDAHDISKWTRNERAAHSFGRFNPFENLFF